MHRTYRNKKLSVAVLVGLLAACGADQTADVTPLTTSTLSNAQVQIAADGFRVVSWQSDEPVTIAVSKAGAPGATIVAEGVEGGEWRYQGPTDDRTYFHLTPENGETTVTALRLLPLEGGRNFRDLGGYGTRDGKTTKWGQLYRSGVMNELTDNDYDYLSDLGIRVVCDFRASEERAEEPTDWRAGVIDYKTWDYSSESGSEFAAVFRNPDATPRDVADMMARMYAESMVAEHAERFAVMFDQIIKGNVPLTFNCSAGKDRTGIAAALLLTALDVRRETILADYAMSEKVVDYMAEFTSTDIPADHPYYFLTQLPKAMVAPLMRSDPRYLQSAFASIEAAHGSVMAFIQTELGVDDGELAALRASLLE